MEYSARKDCTHIRVVIEQQKGCCGVGLLYNFGASIGAKKEHKEDVYQILLERIKTHAELSNYGLIVAYDTDREDGVKRKGDYWDPQYQAMGSYSLEDFCKWAGFKRKNLAYNPNSGNNIAMWTLVLRKKRYDLD